jgi:hypothetical protein
VARRTGLAVRPGLVPSTVASTLGLKLGGVADEIVKVVDMPFGKRPFRIHYDPTEDGANVGFTVLDSLRAEMLHRVGLSDLLKPSVLV